MNVQRLLINNGWTIENRRQLVSKIGQPEYNKFKNTFKKYRISFCDNILHTDKIKLNKDGDSVLLSFEVKNGSTIAFKDENIKVNNVTGSVRSLLGSEFAPKKIDFSPSKVMEKLFSPEFTPKRHIDENGCFVTTIIDKKTGEPVEAYVKQGNANTKERSPILDNQYIESEKWEIYVKDKDVPSKYRRVGHRTFDLDFYENKIEPGYMTAIEGQSEYEGIGVRLHQIAVERMLQEDFNTVEIESLYSAFPFHYKCGFRTTPESSKYLKSMLMESINSWSQTLKRPVNDLKREIIVEDLGDYCETDCGVIEEIKKEICKISGGMRPFEDTSMSLQGEYLRKWIDLAESQPILLNYKKELF